MTFLRFWLQVSLYSGLLMLVYFLVLRNRNAHKVSRAYLLMVSVLPLLLPLADFSSWLPAGNLVPVRWLREVVVGRASKTDTANAFHLNWWYLYMAVSAILLVVFTVRILMLYKTIARHTPVHQQDIDIVYNAPYTGSWLHYLLLEQDVDDPAIIAHEAAHIRSGHSYDLLFVNMVGCFTWLNPFFFLLRSELRMVHEYQADEAALTNVTAYANTLLGHVFKTHTHSFLHTFSKHPLKRRIMMLPQKNRPRKTGYRLAIAGSLMMTIVSAGVFLQSCKEKAVTPNPSTSQTVAVRSANGDVTVDTVMVSDAIVENPQVKPHFNGDIMRYLGENIHYPEAARKKKMEGKVIVKFFVDKTGKILMPTVVRNPGAELAEEALRVISSMPAWKPAMQNGQPVITEFYQPITFRLE